MKRFFIVLISLIIFCIYFKHTSMPMYAGRFTIDINNTTFKTIDGATLEYESANKVITLPKIKPMERLIIIAPTDISDKPLKTRVVLNYKTAKKEIMGEYHILNGSKFNSDISQFAKVMILKNKISVGKNNVLNGFISLKPYIRVIDMNKIK